MHLDKGSILSDTYQHVNFSQLENMMHIHVVLENHYAHADFNPQVSGSNDTLV